MMEEKQKQEWGMEFPDQGDGYGLQPQEDWRVWEQYVRARSVPSMDWGTCGPERCSQR